MSITTKRVLLQRNGSYYNQQVHEKRVLLQPADLICMHMAAVPLLLVESLLRAEQEHVLAGFRRAHSSAAASGIFAQSRAGAGFNGIWQGLQLRCCSRKLFSDLSGSGFQLKFPDSTAPLLQSNLPRSKHDQVVAGARGFHSFDAASRRPCSDRNGNGSQEISSRHLFLQLICAALGNSMFMHEAHSMPALSCA